MATLAQEIDRVLVDGIDEPIKRAVAAAIAKGATPRSVRAFVLSRFPEDQLTAMACEAYAEVCLAALPGVLENRRTNGGPSAGGS